jgi:chromosome segregation ATPase
LLLKARNLESSKYIEQVEADLEQEKRERQIEIIELQRQLLSQQNHMEMVEQRHQEQLTKLESDNHALRDQSNSSRVRIDLLEEQLFNQRDEHNDEVGKLRERIDQLQSDLLTEHKARLEKEAEFTEIQTINQNMITSLSRQVNVIREHIASEMEELSSSIS